MKWVHIGEEIEYDWYELRCQLSQENHLQIFIEGLKNQKLKYCIDFGKILFCRSIDEGWDLNLLEEEIVTSKTEFKKFTLFQSITTKFRELILG